MRMFPTVACALLPALSSAVPVTAWAAAAVALSLASVVEDGHEATPAGASVHVNETVTGAPYQPLALAGRSAAPPIVGAVASTLKLTVRAPSALPARST